jgi:hypothetical protein
MPLPFIYSSAHWRDLSALTELMRMQHPHHLDNVDNNNIKLGSFGGASLQVQMQSGQLPTFIQSPELAAILSKKAQIIQIDEEEWEPLNLDPCDETDFEMTDSELISSASLETRKTNFSTQFISNI